MKREEDEVTLRDDLERGRGDAVVILAVIEDNVGEWGRKEVIAAVRSTQRLFLLLDNSQGEMYSGYRMLYIFRCR